ncbi:putative vacuolar aminopeptidase [Cladorrhinum samala]|uniref:Vacuolar aminopeptidase n=1 Tax=Cladorrhinum samala TaxID=585594 RepID=A0AAV9HCQ4_9PEZI|nr:putative vacuolar aminopeptidase [Cladorrhinum samala]
MTRHTPEFIRARDSNLSLRSMAMEQAMLASRQNGSVETSDKKVDAKDLKPEAFTKPYCEFMTQNPTVFHATAYFKEKLLKAGFTELSHRDSWAGKLQPGGKYFVTRNGSSIIGFAVGKAYKPGNGLAMVAGHIDALTARLKPTSTKPGNNGYIQLGVAQYAGALNETWWDRDLSIGGRVIIRDPETGKTTVKLAKLDWPIARIPTLAPHFGIGMMGHNNRETETVPIIGLDNSDLYPSSSSTSEGPLGGAGSFASTQPPKLVKLIASELGIKDYSTILNWELELYDSQPANVGGLDKEFIFAGRIDDKLCSWAAFMALIHAKHDDSDGVIKLVALFDDEEIGSLLRQGARGNFLPLTIERAVESLSANASKSYDTPSTTFGPGVMGQTYANSFLVSSDVTHAAHPNFTQTNLAGHSPRLNVGVALCVDASAHMTTDSVSIAILDRIASLSGTVNQRHMIRNDSRSGGTVGPMLSSAMGCKAADVGIPQLSMHSIRATTGSLDPGLGLKFYKGFLDNWEKVDNEWRS